MKECLLYSGAAASGKSENFKTLLSQLCLLATKPNKSKSQKLLNNVKKAESIYDAFGHFGPLSTSAFSRYSELQYDIKGKLIGAKTLDYLLEKRRVLGRSGHNFHVFYYLIKGATLEEKSFWRLNDDFNYLKPSDIPKVY
jgi:chitin synthase